MASAWAVSWGDSWGDSWGGAAVAASTNSGVQRLRSRGIRTYPIPEEPKPVVAETVVIKESPDSVPVVIETTAQIQAAMAAFPGTTRRTVRLADLEREFAKLQDEDDEMALSAILNAIPDEVLH